MRLPRLKRGPQTVQTIYLKIMSRQSRQHDCCVLWTGQITSTNRKGSGGGYGQISDTGKTFRVHRVVWQAWFGPIPNDWTIDHVCHNMAADRGECAGGETCLHRRCYNIHHLRIVPIGGNTAASPLTGLGKQLRPSQLPPARRLSEPVQVRPLAPKIPVPRPDTPDAEQLLFKVAAVFRDLGMPDKLPTRVILDELDVKVTGHSLARALTTCRLSPVQGIVWDGRSARGYRWDDVDRALQGINV